ELVRERLLLRARPRRAAQVAEAFGLVDIVPQVEEPLAVGALGGRIERCDAVAATPTRRAAAADEVECMELSPGILQELRDAPKAQLVLHQRTPSPPCDRPVLAVAAEHCGRGLGCPSTRPAELVGRGRTPGGLALDGVLFPEREIDSGQGLQR